MDANDSFGSKTVIKTVTIFKLKTRLKILRTFHSYPVEKIRFECCEQPVLKIVLKGLGTFRGQ